MSSNYYGFVVGGVTPAATIADNIVTAFDQNVQAHLPDATIATTVEDAALRMLLDLVNFDQSSWAGRTFTTGGTAGNVQGLALGREYVVLVHAMRKGLKGEKYSIAVQGVLGACLAAGVKEIRVLTTMGHSSLAKAASIVGIGQSSVIDISEDAQKPWRLDIDSLRRHLMQAEEGVVSIVAISCGEVNTGRFATGSLNEMEQIRTLCDQYGAWLHVDGGASVYVLLEIQYQLPSSFRTLLPYFGRWTRVRNHQEGF